MSARDWKTSRAESTSMTLRRSTRVISITHARRCGGSGSSPNSRSSRSCTISMSRRQRKLHPKRRRAQRKFPVVKKAASVEFQFSKARATLYSFRRAPGTDPAKTMGLMASSPGYAEAGAIGGQSAVSAHARFRPPSLILPTTKAGRRPQFVKRNRLWVSVPRLDLVDLVVEDQVEYYVRRDAAFHHADNTTAPR